MSDDAQDLKAQPLAAPGVAPRAQVFKYQRPELPTGPFQGKVITRLARTDRMMANVQVLKTGGENNLHSHTHLDGFWMVLSGRVRFYGEGDTLLAELGPREGILVPRGFKYWFEALGDEPLELLQVESFDIAIPDYNAIRERERINHTPKQASFGGIVIADARLESPEYGKAPRPSQG
jgi:mannose-6-phosphate isomerase-like protein (cupin superfamily)